MAAASAPRPSANATNIFRDMFHLSEIAHGEPVSDAKRQRIVATPDRLCQTRLTMADWTTEPAATRAAAGFLRHFEAVSVGRSECHSEPELRRARLIRDVLERR